ncbi:MAG: hypothetical protein HY291_14300 [Planctomycetes bacterium]|nr:hypothetical protein [Planctomycetota bacterium]
MARLLLTEKQYEVLEVLVREGGMRFAFLFDRIHSLYGTPAAEVLKAAQDLYDLSFVDVRRAGLGELPAGGDTAGQGEFVDNLDPAEFRKAYRHLDAFNAGSFQADTRGISDPFYFSVSSLGLAEHLKPEYAERAAARRPQNRSAGIASGDGLPPPEALPTPPLD